MSTVAIRKSDSRERGLLDALEMLGGLRRFVDGKRVFVKVNLCLARAPETGGTVDPEVLAVLLKECRRCGADELVVGDGSAVEMATVLKVNPVQQVAEAHGAKFVDLDAEPHSRVRLKRGLILDGLVLADRVLAAEAVINLAKMKTHGVATVTLSMKGLMGCVLGGGEEVRGGYRWWDVSDRRKFHTKDIHKAIVDLNTLVTPALNIVDGFLAQEGDSPFHGLTVPLHAFVAGADRVAADATCCRLMGIRPETIGHIALGEQAGLGTMKPATVGDDVAALVRPFSLPGKPTPHR